MSWRVARSLDVLLDEINSAAPRRSKASDGSIGDAAHATRSSDHNPWVTYGGQGIVRARDFTHDPRGGLDCSILAERLAAIVAAGSHPAARSGAYIIWRRRILSFDRRGEGWRAYYGTNPHTAHLHLSVATDPAGFDSTQPWGVMAPVTTQEDDMPTAQEIADAVWNYRVTRPGKDTKIATGVALAQAWNRSDATILRKQIADVRAAVDRNADRDEVKALLENLDATIVLSINEES